MRAPPRSSSEKPAEALEILQKRFATMDPELLAAAWKVVVEGACEGHPRHHPGARKLAAGQPRAKLLGQKDALKSYEEGLFTDEFLR